MKNIRRNLIVFTVSIFLTTSAWGGRANKAPQASFSFTPSAPMQGDAVQFTDSSSDPDGDVVSWSWNFGNGTTSTVQHPEASFGTAGSYSVRLKVTDNKGATDSDEKTIVVGSGSTEPDVGAALIRLKLDDCPDNNCFTDAGAMLDWIWNVRKPDQAEPLIVDVSPGTFGMPDRFFCQTPASELPAMRGHVTVRGSGQKNTVLTGGHSGTQAVLALSHCTNLDFQDLAVRSDSRRGVAGGSVNGVYWTNATGKSTWTNVHADATYYAWFDECEAQVSNKGLNHWLASRLESRKTSYASRCAANWIFGSELLSRYDDPTVTSGRRIVESDASNGNTGAVWLFGVTVRSETEADGPGATDAQVGVYARNGGAIHVHGGIISLRHDNPANGVDVVPVQSVGAGAFIHAPGAAYALRATGSGIVRRVVMEDGGVAMTPFMWQALSEPPPIESAQGQDVVVETDCSASGCQTVGDEPHMLVYSEACAGGTGGPWFDVVTGSCR